MKKKILFILFSVCSFSASVYSFRSELLKVTYKSRDMNQQMSDYGVEISRDAFSAKALCFKGNTQYILRNLQEALDFYLEALKNNKQTGELSDYDVAKIYFNIGFVYSVLGEDYKAVENYQKCLEFDNKDAEAYFNLGSLFQKQNKLLQALEHYRKAVEKDAKYCDAWVKMAEILGWKNNFEAAADSLSKALTLRSKDLRINLSLAGLFRNMCKYKEAILAYKNALKISPNSIEALYNLGALFNIQGDFLTAIDFFGRALSIDPENIDVQLGMGNAYLGLKKKAYQAVVVNNVSSEGGRRDCFSRYGAVSNVFESYKRPITVLDLGASEGYFSFRLARKYKDSVFVMVEEKKDLLNLCKLNKSLENVVLLNKRITIDELERLGECEHFDIVLGLNIVHWFEDKWKEALEAILELGDFIIIEVPPVGDKDAIGSKYFKEMNDYLLSIGKVIAKASRHTTSLELYSNTYLIERKKDRIYRTYWTFPFRESKYKIESDFEKKTFYKLLGSYFPDMVASDWLPGINLLTFKKLNGVWPTRDMIEKSVVQLNDRWLGDMKIYNLIVQGKNIVPIDFDDPKDEKRFAKEDVKKVLEVLDKDPDQIQGDLSYR